MEREVEILHQRIARYRAYLRSGVVGALAIRYLRQIAEDDEALSRLAAEGPVAMPGSAAVSPYLLRPKRALFAACRDAGRDAAGVRCPVCPVKRLCDAGRLLTPQLSLRYAAAA
jgi:hypothetical protein